MSHDLSFPLALARPLAVGLLAFASLAGCSTSVQSESAPEEPDSFLWKKYLGGSGVDGYASAADLEDATAYYARAAADLSGLPGESGAGVVPATLEDFKTQFNIPTQEEGESVEAYRERTLASVYYNKNELGLGRELVCSASSPETGDIPGFVDSDGESVGVACYVTNYAGDGAFYEMDEAMANATALAPEPKNTVAITYRPTRPEGERVQFWVYGSEGTIQSWAQLDHREGMSDNDQRRPVPSVCTECHGGNYIQGQGVAKNAHFLPVNPFAVELSFSPPDIHDRLRDANCVAWNSNSMTPLQLAWLSSVYGNAGPCTGNTEHQSTPPGWQSDEALWQKAALPYCGSCHLAIPEMHLLESAEIFRSAYLATDLCGTSSSRPVMPHALPTFRALWSGNPSAGSLLLQAHPEIQSCP